MAPLRKRIDKVIHDKHEEVSPCQPVQLPNNLLTLNVECNTESLNLD